MIEETLRASIDAHAKADSKKLPAERKADVVYTQIRLEIERGDLEPGQRLPESWLVEHTGASRTPVRDALRRLEADELVVLEPRQAPRVSTLSLRQVRELFSFRRIVEAGAIEDIALRSQADESIRSDFLALAESFRGLGEGSEEVDFDVRFRQLTRTFDDLVISHADNRFLERSIVGLRSHTTRLRVIAHADRHRLDQSIREHIDMCEAAVQGDPRQAGAAIRQHLHHVERSILEALVSANSPAKGEVGVHG